MSVGPIVMVPFHFWHNSFLFSLILISLARGLSVYWPFQRISSLFHWFFPVFCFQSYWYLLFFYHLFSSTPYLICSFSSFLRWKLRLLILDLSFSYICILCYKFSSNSCLHCIPKFQYFGIFFFMKFKTFKISPRTFFYCALIRNVLLKSSWGFPHCFSVTISS